MDVANYNYTVNYTLKLASMSFFAAIAFTAEMPVRQDGDNSIAKGYTKCAPHINRAYARQKLLM